MTAIIQRNIKVLWIACVIYNIRYQKSPIDFYNGANNDYQFIIKVSAEEFKKRFTCLRENTEKYLTFIVPIQKEVSRIDKNGDEIAKNKCYIFQFVCRIKSLTSSLSNSKLNVNFEAMIKNEKHVELSISLATVLMNT